MDFTDIRSAMAAELWAALADFAHAQWPASPTHCGRILTSPANTAGFAHVLWPADIHRPRLRPASPTNVAGVAHLRWPASRDVGFVAMVLALSFAMLVVSGSRREVTVAVTVGCCKPAPIRVVAITRGRSGASFVLDADYCGCHDGVGRV